MAPPSLTKSDSGTNGVDFTGKPLFQLEDSNLLANGHVVLTDVPVNVTLTTSPYLTDKDGEPIDVSAGSFIGFNVDGEPKSRHVASIGKLKDIRFMSIFRFKVWWTTHWVGSNGRDIENETQIIILDNSESDSGSGSGSGSGRPYVLLLPLIEGSFRSSFQNGENDDVAVCVESGSTQVTGLLGLAQVLSGPLGPFADVKRRSRSFSTRECAEQEESRDGSDPARVERVRAHRREGDPHRKERVRPEMREPYLR